MFTLMHQGGAVMWLILAAGIAGLAVFLERLFHVHRAKIKADDFLRGVCNILRRKNIDEATTICAETPGPVAYLIRAAILHRDQGRDRLERAIDDAALNEIARLERRVGVLATVGHLAPLLGLLGTVLGMIHAFIGIQERGPLVHTGDIAAGIWQALLTTAAGLMVGILSYAGYNLIVAKMDAIVLDMERAAGEMLAFFTDAGGPSGS